MGTLEWTGDTGFNPLYDGHRFQFYSVDPKTAVATSIGQGSVERGTGESDPAYYSGYFTEAMFGANKLWTGFRIGHKIVTSQTQPGLGMVWIGMHGDPGQTNWFTPNTTSPEHGFYESINFYKDETNESGLMVSLAEGKGTLKDPEMVVVQWKWNHNLQQPMAGKIIGTFKDTSPPEMPRLGPLGYVADTIGGDQYAAIITHKGTYSAKTSHWSVATVDLSSDTAADKELVPLDLAGTWSVSGVGVLDQTRPALS